MEALKNIVLLEFLSGYRTAIAVALLLGVVAAEKLAGIDVPGVEVGNDWLVYVLNALGLGGLRGAIVAATNK